MNIRTFLLISCLLSIAIPEYSPAVVGQNYSVRNRTQEEIEINITPVNPLESGDTVYRVRQGKCVEKTIYFTSACIYKICAWGVASGDLYGCISVQSCAARGYIFYADGPPSSGGNVSCGDDWDDDDDNWLSVSCFISSAKPALWEFPPTVASIFLVFLLPLVSAGKPKRTARQQVKRQETGLKKR
ncbi:hypothetical protein DENIS_2512 [Desulfonema ishimotonii]|uniref:Uncharacterized protein n=1 Tax=Desulfonema ishimotonii TaxID=45657 RepID=A0A401FX64_9BACT|nr:hypothetical protein [Desulfonema ishimotonii]GBC61550.1 hypothetical protein DENIS_2512 [Desulfonema ishimotonii]